MADNRSPIERMIDEATGFDPLKAPPQVSLKCPKCGVTKRVNKDKTDPAGTKTVVIQCPNCNPGDFDAPLYYDADGNELNFED